jgi:uncharacterized protein (TIGR00159 family)
MDFVDILLVAGLLYYFYRLMKESGSSTVFTGILVFIVLWIFVSRVLEMRLLGSIFDQMMSVGVLALIIIFQEEIKRFFKTLGSHRHFRKYSDIFSKNKEKKDDKSAMLPIVMACMSLSQQKVGALIIIERDETLDEYMQAGERIDANINQRLIENIFFKNSPLHDGAMIISGGQITAASCILPISHDLDIPKEFGLRHRAARGISKETDALAIVVSEETGGITASYNNEYLPHMDAERLERVLMKGKF